MGYDHIAAQDLTHRGKRLYCTIDGGALGTITHTEGGLHFYETDAGRFGFWRVEVSRVEPDHICREAEYSPYVKACPACVAQLSSNSAAALKAETKKVIRNFQPHTSDQRADRAASHRMGHQQRASIGEYFYTHPEVPGVAFPTRKRAAEAAIART